MKKTALALILIIIIGTLFSACGNKTTTSEATETTTTSSTESTTIIIETEKKEPAKMWEIDWDDTILGPNGFEYQLPDNGWFSTVCYNEGCCILLDCNSRQLYRLDVDGSFEKISNDQKVIEFTVAYDTLYWFNLEREVWCISWEKTDIAELYCEDAIAVSPFTDECEGAVVSPERANWIGYGDLPIYSPYGE